MSQPWLTQCADGHYRYVIYSLGPYIADYPEQALLTCIVQGWCAQYVCVFLMYFTIGTQLISFRCTAPSDDLDRPSVC